MALSSARTGGSGSVGATMGELDRARGDRGGRAGDSRNLQRTGSQLNRDFRHSSLGRWKRKLAWLRAVRRSYVVLVADDGGEVVAWGCLHPSGSKPGVSFHCGEFRVRAYGQATDEGIGAVCSRQLIAVGDANGFHTIIARHRRRQPWQRPLARAGRLQARRRWSARWAISSTAGST